MSMPAIWISFDLGVQGDYEGLYRWLDVHEATECGDNVAFLHYGTDDPPEEVRVSLQKFCKIGPKARVYVIYRDSESDKLKGKFVFGRRKAPAWAGFGDNSESKEDS